MPTITRMLAIYQPGRDQNAVSPIVPKPDSPWPPISERRTDTMAWIVTVNLRSLRVKSHIERGCAVRLERQLPFLDTQNRMPGFHAVATWRKIADGKWRAILVCTHGIIRVVDRIPPILHVGMHAALHGEDFSPFDQMDDIGGAGCFQRRPMEDNIHPGLVIGVALNIVRHGIPIGHESVAAYRSRR